AGQAREPRADLGGPRVALLDHQKQVAVATHVVIARRGALELVGVERPVVTLLDAKPNDVVTTRGRDAGVEATVVDVEVLVVAVLAGIDDPVATIAGRA